MIGIQWFVDTPMQGNPTGFTMQCCARTQPVAAAYLEGAEPPPPRKLGKH